ncbi:MAG TPA: alpha/beta fold hydrolase [Patescibacteria group bacterium]|nr:alpha/beta fold hydrolase [Patescibacteria group bacterium]
MKKVILVHGWTGTPHSDWLPWLKNELEERNFEVIVPQLPNTDYPHIDTWVPALAAAVDKPGVDTYFVGHSMGCQTIARYLEGLNDGIKVGGVVFVAGFFKRLTEIDEEDKDIEIEWLSAPIDLSKVKERISKSVAIFSDNDKFVPEDNIDDFRDKLGSEIVIEHNMHHFNQGAGIRKAPIVLTKLLEICK